MSEDTSVTTLPNGFALESPWNGQSRLLHAATGLEVTMPQPAIPLAHDNLAPLFPFPFDAIVKIENQFTEVRARFSPLAPDALADPARTVHEVVAAIAARRGAAQAQISLGGRELLARWGADAAASVIYTDASAGLPHAEEIFALVRRDAGLLVFCKRILGLTLNMDPAAWTAFQNAFNGSLRWGSRAAAPPPQHVPESYFVLNDALNLRPERIAELPLLRSLLSEVAPMRAGMTRLCRGMVHGSDALYQPIDPQMPHVMRTALVGMFPPGSRIAQGLEYHIQQLRVSRDLKGMGVMWLTALGEMPSPDGYRAPAQQPAATVAAPPAPTVAAPQVVDARTVRATFLDASIIGTNLHCALDRIGKPEPQDTLFEPMGGIAQRSGRFDWMCDESGTSGVGQVIDVRYVFPNARIASDYLHRVLGVLSEGLPEVTGMPPLGEETHVFAGNPLGARMGIDAGIFTHVFRIDDTVGRVTVATHPYAADGERVSLPKARALAEVAALRVRSPGAAPPDPSRLAWLHKRVVAPPPPAADVMTAEDMRCPHCNAIQRRYLKFCMNCSKLLGNAPPAPPAPPANIAPLRRGALRFTSGKYQGGEFPVRARPIEIGRSSELDMVLVEDLVSPRHARVTTENGEIWIEDLGSTNGTFVNGNKIAGRTKLGVGDRLLIGTNILTLVEK
jgi:pSer/pThr/pTyr-binding forkhead associated (FHA) protein